MIPNIGDRVRVWGACMGREYRADGQVEKLQRDRGRNIIVMFVDGHWWECLNDIVHGYEIIAPADAQCRRCGEANVPMIPIDVTSSYGEDGREDPAGCFVEHRTEWRCADQDGCRERWREMWALQREIARGDDMAAREAGWGQIRNF